MSYRAVWYASNDHKVSGNLTNLEDATAQVKFLKKYRVAWLEDETGKRIEIDE